MIAALVVVAAGALWPWMRGSTARRGSTDVDPVDLCARIEDAARAVRSGSSLRAALVEFLGPVGAGPALSGGRHLVESIEHWATTAPPGPERTAATALVVAAIAGGPQALALDTAAGSIRSTLAIEAEAKAHSAQARLSALVIAVLPLGFLLLTASGGSRTNDVLLHTAAGRACLVAGITLDACGALWLRLLVRRVR